MNFERIRPSIDVDAMQQCHITMVGGAIGLAADLVRSGLGSVSLVDYDHIDSSNPARQDFVSIEIGFRKVEAAAAWYRRINPDIEVETHVTNFCAIPRDTFDELFGHTDLFVLATDFFPAQARGNLEAVRLGKPSLSIGLYRGARAGEVVLQLPGRACYRCICKSRYDAFTTGQTQVTSAGGTILDLRLVDAVAGYLAVGVLTQGADNRFGTLIEKLNSRNLFQIKLDPDYTLGERDIFREFLGEHPANFSFNTIALSIDRDEQCPDCAPIHARRERLTCDAS